MNPMELTKMMKRHRRAGDIPLNNSPALAQWALERGKDGKMDGWGYLFLWLFFPPLALIFIPWGIFNLVEGKKWYKYGEILNEAGSYGVSVRPKNMKTNRVSRGYDWGPGSRWDDAPEYPPYVPVYA